MTGYPSSSLSKQYFSLHKREALERHRFEGFDIQAFLQLKNHRKLDVRFYNKESRIDPEPLTVPKNRCKIWME